MQTNPVIKKILLAGNPNVGKSTIFNALCNRKQKTGNYAGVTVARLSGMYHFRDSDFEIIDLPGAYSIYTNSEDEAIFLQSLTNRTENDEGVIYIADALNIKRGLLLFRQIQDLGVPTILVINQQDEAEKRGIQIDTEKLSQLLQTKVILTNAKEKNRYRSSKRSHL